MRPLHVSFAILVAASIPALAEARVITVGEAGSDPVLLNRDLGGTTQGSTHPNVNQKLEDIRVPHMRIDTWFESGAYTCMKDPGGTPVVDFTAIDQRVANVRAAGAEPLVIIDYMPPCLSRVPVRGPWDAQLSSRQPPLDYDEWEALVYVTVKHLVETPGLDVRWFEAWNEPNLPQFFQGTLAEYLLIYDRIERAVCRVEMNNPLLELHLGGPAIAFPDPVWLGTFLGYVVAGQRKLDFVSWHWYANYPLFGPLFGTPPASFPPANVPNPLLSPQDYADHTAFVRSLVGAAWTLRADTAPEPFLWIDEWNLNAGRDARHDTSEAAGFAAAVLDQMQRAGLERSSFFNVEDATDLNFNQGMFFIDRSDPEHLVATPKPVYQTFRFWSRMQEELLPVEVSPAADLPGVVASALRQENLGAIASRTADGTRITVLLYNWRARDKRRESVTLTFPGAVSGTREILSAGADPTPVSVSGSSIELTLDDSSVAFLDLVVEIP